MTSNSSEPLPRDDRPCATLVDLPAELILRIFSEVNSNRTLSQVRLVCHIFNEMAKNRVAERLIVDGLDHDRVEEIASKPNVFDGACRVLRIEGHYRIAGRDQWGLLAKLIRRMEHIHTVHWIVDEVLEVQIIESISRLSSLESLYVTFPTIRPPPENIESLMLPQSTLRRLRRISMHFQCTKYYHLLPWRLSDAKSVIEYLIAHSPALEHLEIGPPISFLKNIATPLDLDDIFATLHQLPNFIPCLRTLSPWAIKFPVADLNAMGFFKQLSCLHIPNDREEDMPVWPALLASGIKLAIIKVKILTSGLIEYLHGYHGLRSFRIQDIEMPYVVYVRDEAVLRLLTHALPEHTATLSDLHFCPVGKRVDDEDVALRKPTSMLWDIARILQLMRPFNNLERLDLLHYTDDMSDETQRQTLASNLNAIIASHSPRLTTVYLKLVGVDQPFNGDSSDPLRKARNLLNCVGQVDLRGSSIHWRDLRIVIGTAAGQRLPVAGFPVDLHSFAFKAVRVREPAGTFRLAPDVTATELLNEPRWDSDEEPSL